MQDLSLDSVAVTQPPQSDPVHANQLSIASLVVGVLSLIATLAGFNQIILLIAGGVAIVQGSIALVHSKSFRRVRLFSSIGVFTGALAIILSLTFAVTRS